MRCPSRVTRYVGLALLAAVTGACSAQGSDAERTSLDSPVVTPPAGALSGQQTTPAAVADAPPGSAGAGAEASSVGPGDTASMSMLDEGQAGADAMDPMPMVDAGRADPAVDAGTTPQSGMANPSAGCSAGTGRPTGGVVTVAGSHYLMFPEGYDGTVPHPVLLGFHGCGGVNRGTGLDDTEWVRLTRATRFEDAYVRVVPLSSDPGGCWSYGTDMGRVLMIHDELLASYCVDTDRVFATGHSSGAQLIVQIVTQQHASDAQHLGLRALAPVAASDYGAIAGPMPVMYIQGQMDAERGHGDGHETVERFVAANGCGGTSMPYSQVAGCQSGTTAVGPGCIVYDGCQAPTVWCSHNDPAYNGTMHGVPCFAMTAMYDFFESFE